MALLATWPPERCPGSVRQVGESSQTALRCGRAKLSPSLHPPPSGSRGDKSRYFIESTTCRYSGKRSASGRRRDSCGQVLCRCGYVVKVKPCPHIHAGSALVHQAQDWRGGCALVWEGGRGEGRLHLAKAMPGGRAGKRSAARLHGWLGLSQSQQLVGMPRICSMNHAFS